MAAADGDEDNLTDNDLQSEIELVGDLVVAASASDGPLPQDEVDLLLGVCPGAAHPQAHPHEAGPVLAPGSQAKGQTPPR